MTPDDRAHLLALTNADSIETAWSMHVARMADFGFDRLLYGFTRYRTPTSLGDPNDFLVLTNHRPAYTREFIGNGLYRHSPMVRWALENDGPRSWAVTSEALARGALNEDARRVIAFNAAQQVTAGYTIGFKSLSHRAKGAIALTARPGMSQDEVDRIWAAHGDTLLLHNNVLHLRILTLPYIPPDQSLTPRQREALEWVGDGKTMQDIAQIMGLTQATVEKHLRRARDTLNVETTAQAVAKATFLNQMFTLGI
ncbi:helix-turn-helix transcriptional regulator [Alloyangia pacifica]|uniref:LuxR family transcriptional regulator n=1 Tax=Alloyangia pacifica TaxID=311180 RepID=A0A1I6PHM8_9RHOB|nr:LuxR family transcriptional regulator [Alloyangia pacifica]SDG28052.1 LuxR family transcriptional regulator [Alloyangia pacifica]SFS39680.1 LuxR family transcriptional regulator [Alloyangia pacifica]